jgi:hypothetical protein
LADACQIPGMAMISLIVDIESKTEKIALIEREREIYLFDGYWYETEVRTINTRMLASVSFSVFMLVSLVE